MRKIEVRIAERLGIIDPNSTCGKAMVRKDPTQAIVMVISALLFSGIVGVTIAHKSVTTAPNSPDPIATYGDKGK